MARHGNFEDAKVVLGHGCGIAVPVVKVADEVGSQGVRCPLAIHDVAIGLHLEAKALIALRGGQLQRRYEELGGACP